MKTKVFGKFKLTKTWKIISKSFLYVYLRENKRIKKIINQFNHKCTFALVSDMINERRKNSVPYDEYFLFGFDSANDSERRSFVTDIERVDVANSLNLSKNDPIFYDKGLTYEIFGEYYGRDVLRLKSYDDKDAFLKFIFAHPKFICKPIDGGCGVGIKIIDISLEESEELLFEKLIREYKGKCIIEELIIQADELKALHESSVNTVRVPSIRFDNRVEIVHPFLRVGKGGNITDNAGSGGIICALDSHTGTVIATADEFGNKYDVHPDTNQALLGFKIPRWEEAVELVNKLAQIVPDNRYCSWDLALTENGWIMVEVNAKGQFVWQYATKVGFREEMNEMLKELKC